MLMQHEFCCVDLISMSWRTQKTNRKTSTHLNDWDQLFVLVPFQSTLPFLVSKRKRRVTTTRWVALDVLMQHEFCCVDLISKSWRTQKTTWITSTHLNDWDELFVLIPFQSTLPFLVSKRRRRVTTTRWVALDVLMQHEFCCVDLISKSWRTQKENWITSAHLNDRDELFVVNPFQSTLQFLVSKRRRMVTTIRSVALDVLMQHKFCCVELIGRSWRTRKTNQITATHLNDWDELFVLVPFQSTLPCLWVSEGGGGVTTT